jgi:hypothetical protein
MPRICWSLAFYMQQHHAQLIPNSIHAPLLASFAILNLLRGIRVHRHRRRGVCGLELGHLAQVVWRSERNHLGGAKVAVGDFAVAVLAPVADVAVPVQHIGREDTAEGQEEKAQGDEAVTCQLMGSLLDRL